MKKKICPLSVFLLLLCLLGSSRETDCKIAKCTASTISTVVDVPAHASIPQDILPVLLAPGNFLN